MGGNLGFMIMYRSLLEILQSASLPRTPVLVQIAVCRCVFCNIIVKEKKKEKVLPASKPSPSFHDQ